MEAFVLVDGASGRLFPRTPGLGEALSVHTTRVLEDLDQRVLADRQLERKVGRHPSINRILFLGDERQGYIDVKDVRVKGLRVEYSFVPLPYGDVNINNLYDSLRNDGESNALIVATNSKIAEKVLDKELIALGYGVARF